MIDRDITLIEIDDMQKIIKKNKEDAKKDSDSDSDSIKMVGIIEKSSFDIIPHMIVLVGEERIWLEGPIEAFEGKKEDYTIGKKIEIRGKSVGTIVGNCDLGKIKSLPLYVADWIFIKEPNIGN